MPHHVKGCRNSETDCISCFCFLSKGIELIIFLLNVGSRCPIIFLVDVIGTQDCSIEGMMLDFNSGEKKYFLLSSFHYLQSLTNRMCQLKHSRAVHNFLNKANYWAC
ncbi:hypothetical protein NC651_016505 [Populus alba x Populus x berolinensis]|nr:hypothetical protein NC651_016505 [Populus alba x Populus x berolinensis]